MCCLYLCVALYGFVLIAPQYTTSETSGYTRKGVSGVNGSVWSSPEDFPLDSAVFRWGLASGTTCDGLGCGITWAIHPRFCLDLIQLFPERNGIVSFVTCHTLRSAVVRAMSTWEMNNQHIKFTDVSEECNRSFTMYDTCMDAELVIRSSDMKRFGAETSRYAAMVVNNMTNLNHDPRSTTGRHVGGGFGLRGSTMYVSTHTCWYLDATFCYTFNQLRLHFKDSDVALIIKLFAFVLFAVSACVLVVSCLKVLFAAGGLSMCMTKSDRRRKDVSQLGEEVSLPARALTSAGAKLEEFHTVPILLTMIGLVLGPVFYLQFFLPCWDCYDFEATIAHEVGHVLGFGHPDADAEMNLMVKSGLQMNQSTCVNPLDYVELSSPFSVQNASVMFSVTKHRDKTCLSVDDMEGLNFLYPSCQNYRHHPYCLKQSNFLGYIRLAVAASVPFLLVSMFVMLLQCLASRHNKREIRLIRKARRKSKIKTKWLRASLRASVQDRKSCREAEFSLPGVNPCAHKPTFPTSATIKSLVGRLKQHPMQQSQPSKAHQHKRRAERHPDHKQTNTEGTAFSMRPQTQNTEQYASKFHT